MASEKYRLSKLEKEKDLDRRITDYKKISITHGEYAPGKEIEPKRIIEDKPEKILSKKPEQLKAGDRIIHNKKKVSGRNIYADPAFWEDK